RRGDLPEQRAHHRRPVLPTVVVAGGHAGPALHRRGRLVGAARRRRRNDRRRLDRAGHLRLDLLPRHRQGAERDVPIMSESMAHRKADGTDRTPVQAADGVGPWVGPRPDGDQWDDELLAAGDTRNVVDKYRYWRHEAIVADLDRTRTQLHIAVENWQ